MTTSCEQCELYEEIGYFIRSSSDLPNCPPPTRGPRAELVRARDVTTSLALGGFALLHGVIDDGVPEINVIVRERIVLVEVVRHLLRRLRKTGVIECTDPSQCRRGTSQRSHTANILPLCCSWSAVYIFWCAVGQRSEHHLSRCKPSTPRWPPSLRVGHGRRHLSLHFGHPTLRVVGHPTLRVGERRPRGQRF